MYSLIRKKKSALISNGFPESQCNNNKKQQNSKTKQKNTKQIRERKSLKYILHSLSRAKRRWASFYKEFRESTTFLNYQENVVNKTCYGYSFFLIQKDVD